MNIDYAEAVINTHTLVKKNVHAMHTLPTFQLFEKKSHQSRDMATMNMNCLRLLCKEEKKHIITNDSDCCCIVRDRHTDNRRTCMSMENRFHQR